MIKLEKIDIDCWAFVTYDIPGWHNGEIIRLPGSDKAVFIDELEAKQAARDHGLSLLEKGLS